MPKFISEKAASKATPSKVIKYILNENKVCKDENGELVMSTIGLDEDRPYSQQFKEVAEVAGNNYTTSDRKYYHFKISCAPGDYSPDGVQKITPEQLKKEAEDFVLKNFEGYQAVITIQYHGEQNPFLHAHIVINASSYDVDKNKIDLRNRDLDSFRDQVYEMGKPYGLEGNYWRDEVAAKRAEQRQARAQEQPEAINRTEGEKLFEVTHGKNFSDYSWKEQYRIAIDEAKKATTNLETFKDYLKENFHIDTQITKQGNIKYKFPERTTYSSGKALGSDYELEAIEKSLEETKNRPSDLPKEPSENKKQAFEKAVEWHKKFNEEYAKFQKWQEEDYKKQREEWRRKEKEGDASAEYFRNKLLLENSAELYRLFEQVRENEILAASLTKKEEAQLRELEEKKNELERQQQQAQLKAIHGVSSQAYNPERERVLEMREQRRQQYIDTLNTAGTSLIDRINAAQGIRDMNIEEGKTSREQELYNIKDATLRRRPIYAKRDWELQRQVDSVRIARELGANTSAELELKVKNEGREYGKIKREYTAAKKQYDEAVNTASTEILNDSALSVEERIERLEKIKNAEFEKMKSIDEKFHKAKEHYKDCARALDTVKANNARNDIYITPEQPQAEKKEEAPRRTKEEAEKERLKQWSEIRDWSDEAIKKAASRNSYGKENDLKEWAAEMERHGCQVRITANTISVKHPNSNQAVRTNRLGGAYERKEIINGISIQRETNRSTNRTAQQQPDRNGRASQGNSRTQSIGKERIRERGR